MKKQTKQLIGIDSRLLPLKSLKETPGNPQRMDDKTFTGIVESMKVKGWLLDPPVIWEKEENNFQIISGHHRIQAAIKAGIIETQCKVLKGITEEQAKILVLEANQRKGSFDDDLLNVFVDDIIENYDYDIDTLIDEVGFDDDFIYNINNEPNEKDDEVPEVSEIALSQPGDLYLLNNHRILCGDSTDEKQVKFLLNNQVVDMIFTDPPYNMDFGGGGCFDEKTQKLKNSLNGMLDFDPNKIKYLLNSEIGTLYICTSKKLIPEYLNIFRGWSFDILVWCKTNPIPMNYNNFIGDIEYILYFKQKLGVWNNSLKPTEIYKKYYISSISEGRKDFNSLHPTMKPVGLIENRIKISSNKNGVVFDLFLGSGSTLIASEKTNRICYGMEIDPQYIDVIIKRYIDYTGTKENCFLVRDNKTIPLNEIEAF